MFGKAQGMVSMLPAKCQLPCHPETARFTANNYCCICINTHLLFNVQYVMKK